MKINLKVRKVGGYGGHEPYGSLSSSGYGCYEDEVSIALLITAIAGIGLMWYILYTKIQANGGRRKRETEDRYYQDIPSYISGVFSGKVIKFLYYFHC